MWFRRDKSRSEKREAKGRKSKKRRSAQSPKSRTRSSKYHIQDEESSGGDSDDGDSEQKQWLMQRDKCCDARTEGKLTEWNKLPKLEQEVLLCDDLWDDLTDDQV